MKLRTEYLNPRVKLVDATVDWLLAQARREEGTGALSLDHVLVVVPTAAAGSRLRLALVKRVAGGCGGLVPPAVRTPNGVLLGREALKRESAAEEFVARAEVLRTIPKDENIAALYPGLPENPEERPPKWAAAMARQIERVSRRIGENGCSFASVAQTVEEKAAALGCPEEEHRRWRALQAIEERVGETLEARGLKTHLQNVIDAVSRPELPDGIELIVLPALMDAMPALYRVLPKFGREVAVLCHAEEGDGWSFDEWGRPGTMPAYHSPLLKFENLFFSATEDELAKDIVKNWKSGDALALADPFLFPALDGEFASSPRTPGLHNPAPRKLAASSFGRLILQVRELCREACAWETVAAFVRNDDVRTWLLDDVFQAGEDVAKRASVWKDFTGQLDRYQNRNLPVRFRDCVFKTAEPSNEKRDEDERLLAKFREALPEASQGTVADIVAALSKIYAGRKITLEGDDADGASREGREFRRAVTAAMDFFETIREPRFLPYFDELFDELRFDIEPESEALTPDGWRELAWSSAETIHVAGFNEGRVPDSVAGDSFVPDSLARELGLATNESRYMRDAFLLDELVRSRAAGGVCGVNLYFAARNAKGPLKPSRLLFRCGDDELVRRARTFYPASAGPRPAASGGKAQGLVMDIPIPDEVHLCMMENGREKHLSPSKIDDYLRNPLRMYLEDILGFRNPVADDLQEWNAMDFGTICHEAVDAFAGSKQKDSTDEREIAKFLDNWLREHCAPQTAMSLLQVEAVRERLRAFAQWQAKEAVEWEIVEHEKHVHEAVIEGVTFGGEHAILDRLDQNRKTGEYRLVDYKTWNKYEKNEPWKFDNVKLTHVHHLQLPIYIKCLEQADKRVARAGYYVFGSDTSNPWHEVWKTDDTELCKALDEAICATVRKIKAGIFVAFDENREIDWGRMKEISEPGRAFPNELAKFFRKPLEKSLPEKWIKDQRDRIKRFREK